MSSGIESLGLAVAALAVGCERVPLASPPAVQAAVTSVEADARGGRDEPGPREFELERENSQLREQLKQRELASAASLPASMAALQCEVADLKAELEREQEKRIEREREWQRYTDALRSLQLDVSPDDLTFKVELPADELPRAEVPPPVVDDSALVERSAAVARSLRTLLAIEGVRGLDLFDAGRLGDGWIGPVVFRLLDEHGRLAGSLCAERLRLEGSRSARTLTMVLEEGFERRGGERVEFPRELSAAAIAALLGGTPLDPAALAASSAAPDPNAAQVGVRRIALPEVDPLPWVQAVPELFGGATLDEPKDDGQWSLAWVRGSLNQLLRVDTAHGYWRLKALGGVQAGVLRDVHLEGFDQNGTLERRLFADRMTLVRQEKGVLLLLEDGAQTRGEEKTPFLDRRFRIFLPRAAHAQWEAAGLPGWSKPILKRDDAGAPPAVDNKSQ